MSNRSQRVKLTREEKETRNSIRRGEWRRMKPGEVAPYIEAAKGGVEARKRGRPLEGMTLGGLLEAMRTHAGMTQPQMAKRLDISPQHLNDIEKGRKALSVERAARFASELDENESVFVALAIQEMIDEAGLKLTVTVEAG